jgi:preprotein translocase subunit YajC
VTPLLPLLLVPLCWLLVIRPQRQRVARQQQLLASVRPGDEVITASGILARVAGVAPDHISLEIADGVVIRVVPAAVTGRSPRVAAAPVEGAA